MTGGGKLRAIAGGLARVLHLRGYWAGSRVARHC